MHRWSTGVSTYKFIVTQRIKREEAEVRCSCIHDVPSPLFSCARCGWMIHQERAMQLKQRQLQADRERVR